MRFTLIYDGPLPAQSAHDSRVSEKHDIRREFHVQLEDLWANHPALRDKFNEWKSSEAHRREGKELPYEKTLSANPDTGPAHTASPAQIIEPRQVANSRFIALIADHTSLLCELDVLFLRKEPKGHLVNQAGDLDNRIKVLFDALRMPLNEAEIPSGVTLPDPFFCLLEDDRLIIRVNIASERLLEGTVGSSKNHVRLVINVITRADRLNWLNLGIAE